MAGHQPHHGRLHRREPRLPLSRPPYPSPSPSPACPTPRCPQGLLGASCPRVGLRIEAWCGSRLKPQAQAGGSERRPIEAWSIEARSVLRCPLAPTHPQASTHARTHAKLPEPGTRRSVSPRPRSSAAPDQPPPPPPPPSRLPAVTRRGPRGGALSTLYGSASRFSAGPIGFCVCISK